MSAKVSSIEYVDAVASAVSYKLAKAGTVTYPYAVIGELIASSSAFTGLIRDSAVIIENLSYQLSTALPVDQLVLEEAIGLEFSTLVNNIVTVIEAATLDITKQTNEVISLQEYIELNSAFQYQNSVSVNENSNRSIFKRFQDYITLTESFDTDQYGATTILQDSASFTELLTYAATQRKDDPVAVLDDLVLASSLVYHNVANLQEIIAINTYRALSSAITNISDNTVWGMTKGVPDVISTIEKLTFDVITVLKDQAAVVELVALAISKPLGTDVAFIGDFSTVNPTLNKNDSIFFAENYIFDFAWGLPENITLVETLNLNVQQPQTDVTSVTDYAPVHTTKNFYDSITLVDYSDISLGNRFVGENNNTTILDTQNIVFNKSFTDTTSVLETKVLEINRVIVDNIGISDHIVVRYDAAARSLFNELLFNNSTFG